MQPLHTHVVPAKPTTRQAVPRESPSSQVLKDRFSLFSHCLQDVFFGVAAAADARGPDARHRQRLVHKLLLDYAREQAHQRNPLLFH